MITKYDITDYLKDDKELQKAVIEELLNENAKLNAIIDSYQPRLQRYKDILQEIREIAEEQINTRMLLADKKSFHKFHGIYVLITKAEEEDETKNT